MYFILTALLISAVSGSFLRLEACEEVESMREYGTDKSEPEDFESTVEQCLEEIEQILNINNWRSRFARTIFDALEYFDDYAAGDYDSECDSDEEDTQRSSLRDSWKECLFDIQVGADNLDTLVDRIREEISCGTNYSVVSNSLDEDAKSLANEIIGKKPSLALLRNSLRREIGLPVEDEEEQQIVTPEPATTTTFEPIAKRLRSSYADDEPIARRLRSSRK